MPDVFLNIFENSKYNATFLKCNSNLIRENYHLFESLNSDEERFSLLETLWKTKLNIKLIPSRNWKQLNFQSDKDKTLFLLKWQC